MESDALWRGYALALVSADDPLGWEVDLVATVRDATGVAVNLYSNAQCKRLFGWMPRDRWACGRILWR